MFERLVVSKIALIGFRGLLLPRCPRSAPHFLRLLNHKGFKEESMTKVELYAIGTSTTLESNKSLPHICGAPRMWGIGKKPLLGA
jgi:hypothetical protein